MWRVIPISGSNLLQQTSGLPALAEAGVRTGVVPHEASRSQSRYLKLSLLTGVFLLQFLFFGFVALHRFIDGDEGFFLLASRLVLMHKKPYVDFLYEQAPLLPYTYALWMKMAGVTWASAKLFAALLTALLGTLVCEHIYHETRNWVAGFSAVVMFAVSTLVFGFFPVVKTYSLAGLLLFAAYVIVSRFGATSPQWLMGIAGLLFGLSVDTRSYLLLLAPLFVWWIFRNTDAGSRRTAIVWFCSGLVLGNLPAIYLFFCSPGAFLFNNLGFHAVRSPGGLVGMWQEKLLALLVTFLGHQQSNGLQTSLLFLISLGFVFSVRRRNYSPRLAFLVAMVLGIVSLLPTPVHPQYFCLCIPFLLVSAICVVNDLLADFNSRGSKLAGAVAVAVLLGIYVAASASDFRRYLITGESVPGVHLSRDNADWKLQRVLEVSQAIDQVARPGESVASFWPGYVFQTRTNPFPGFEADYGLLVAEKLTPQQRASYHVLSAAEIAADFAAHTPRVVVLRDEIPLQGGEMLRDLLRREDALRSSLSAHQYTVARTVGGVSIYVYSPQP